jgi:prevent-host-death family protein
VTDAAPTTLARTDCSAAKQDASQWMMERIATSKARKEFAELMKRASEQGKRVKITLYGKTLAGLVPAKDLDRLRECEEKDEPRPKRQARR